MNRFEQQEPLISRKILYYIPIVAFVLLLVFFLRGLSSVNDATLSKQQESLETALSRSIAQCYAVEGSYPPSLEYLVEHYGLLYDSTVFMVNYEYYGGNLLPDVTILRRTQ